MMVTMDLRPRQDLFLGHLLAVPLNMHEDILDVTVHAPSFFCTRSCRPFPACMLQKMIVQMLRAQEACIACMLG